MPSWAYHSEAILTLERDRVFRTHWQIVGHVNDMPEPGDYLTLDLMSERAVVIRSHDGTVRAFHNICRHRGTRVVSGARGHCNKAVICPFHGWAYNLDGSLRGIAERTSFPPLERAEWGLLPLDLEIWQGFVFVKFQPSEVPSVARQLARHADEVAHYNLTSLVPSQRAEWSDTLDANWKCLREVDNEGYHVRQAHPALHDLYGDRYADNVWDGNSSRSEGKFNTGPGRLWSVRKYREVLAAEPGLPATWVYLYLFPNTVIALYPDSVNWYREAPLAVGKTRQDGRIYRYPDESRVRRVARYLSARIDRTTTEEDHMLTVWSYEATKSVGFSGVLLSDLEHGLKSFHDALKARIPELSAADPPNNFGPAPATA